MAKKEKCERDRICKSQPDPAEQFKPSEEDKFPDLTREYWKNPNAQRGKMHICPGAQKAENYKHIEQGV